MLVEIWTQDGGYVGRVFVHEWKGFEWYVEDASHRAALEKAMLEIDDLREGGVEVRFGNQVARFFERLSPQWALLAFTLYLPEGYRAKFDSRTWDRSEPG